MQFQVLNALAISTNKTGIKRVFLIRGNRTVLGGRRFASLSPLLGNKIVFPIKLKLPSILMHPLTFLSQVLSQTAMTGAVIGTNY
jgi:hypothetical protein